MPTDPLMLTAEQQAQLEVIINELEAALVKARQGEAIVLKRPLLPVVDNYCRPVSVGDGQVAPAKLDAGQQAGLAAIIAGFKDVLAKSRRGEAVTFVIPWPAVGFFCMPPVDLA